MATPAKKPIKSGTTPKAPAKSAKGQPPKKAAVAKMPAKAAKAPARPVEPVAPAGPNEVKRPPSRPRKSPFTPKELEAVRQVLEGERAKFQQEADDLNAGTFDISQSELSGEVAFDEEYADAGTFTFERERDLSLSNNIRDLMEKVNLALLKIDRGTYGICERCGDPIPKDRMHALPYSVLCLRCKQLEERQR